MQHSIKIRGSVLGAALLIGLASFGSVRSAHASSTYPAAMKAALEKHFQKVANPGSAVPTFCVPLCTACHNTTAGGPANLNVFGTNLFLKGRLTRSNDAKVEPALEAVFAITPPLDSDGDGKSDELELSQLSSPSLREPRGVTEFCPDIAYGCGASVAAAPPPVDRTGLFAAAGLVLAGLAVFRRRARRSPTR